MKRLQQTNGRLGSQAASRLEIRSRFVHPSRHRQSLNMRMNVRMCVSFAPIGGISRDECAVALPHRNRNSAW